MAKTQRHSIRALTRIFPMSNAVGGPAYFLILNSVLNMRQRLPRVVALLVPAEPLDEELLFT